ncbi:hypothetical protein JOQ06_002078, partial [Pogonophryne albipinna]
ATLCSMKGCMRAMVAQLKSDSEDLQQYFLSQVIASVLRNLSWRADVNSKKTLREVGSVRALTGCALEVQKESTLKSVLSALWNLSAHCTENKADICSVDGALGFLVGTLTHRSHTNTLAIIESGGGILRNVSSLIATNEAHRQILRDHGCLPTLLQHLKSHSLTIVSNACGTLWNLSARDAKDQEALWELGAVGMLRNLIHSRHKMIAMGSAAALRNLMANRPARYKDASVVSPGAGAPSLHARKQKALFEELDAQQLSETFDNIDNLSPKAAHRKGRGCSGATGGGGPTRSYTNTPVLSSPKSADGSKWTSEEPFARPVFPPSVRASSDSLNSVTSADGYGNRGKTKPSTEPFYSSDENGGNKCCVYRKYPADLAHKIRSANHMADDDGGELDTPINYSLKYSDEQLNSGRQSPSHRGAAESEEDEPLDARLRRRGDSAPKGNRMAPAPPQRYIATATSNYSGEAAPEQPIDYSLKYGADVTRKPLFKPEESAPPSAPPPPPSSGNKLRPPPQTKRPTPKGSQEAPQTYCVEDTPICFSRGSSLSSLEKEEQQRQQKESPPEPPYAQETPLMFSRCTSVSSLDSFSTSSIASSVRSSEPCSGMPSGVVSPSDLPDSPGQTMPPSRAKTPPPPSSKQEKKKQEEESSADVMLHFATESTPHGFSRASSLSALSVDEPYIMAEMRKEEEEEASEERKERKERKEREEREEREEEEGQLDESDDDDDIEILEACIKRGRSQSQQRKDGPSEEVPRIYCVEGTPLNFSTATSLSDLTIDSPPNEEAAPTAQPSNQSRGAGLRGAGPPEGDNGDDILAECISAAMPKARPRKPVRAAPGEIQAPPPPPPGPPLLGMQKKKPTSPVKPMPPRAPYSISAATAAKAKPGFTFDSPHHYTPIEGTPCCFSRNDSLSSLDFDEDEGGEKDEEKRVKEEDSRKRKQQTAAVVPRTKPAANLPDDRQKFCIEDTPVCFSRNSSLSSLSDIDQENNNKEFAAPPPPEQQEGGTAGRKSPPLQEEQKPRPPASGYAPRAFHVEDTPVCFSRNSSLSSLSIDSEDDLLQECISSAMPKKKKKAEEEPSDGPRSPASPDSESFDWKAIQEGANSIVSRKKVYKSLITGKPRVEARGRSQPQVEARGRSQPQVEARGRSQPRAAPAAKPPGSDPERGSSRDSTPSRSSSANQKGGKLLPPRTASPGSASSSSSSASRTTNKSGSAVRSGGIPRSESASRVGGSTAAKKAKAESEKPPALVRQSTFIKEAPSPTLKRKMEDGETASSPERSHESPARPQEVTSSSRFSRTGTWKRESSSSGGGGGGGASGGGKHSTSLPRVGTWKRTGSSSSVLSASSESSEKGRSQEGRGQEDRKGTWRRAKSGGEGRGFSDRAEDVWVRLEDCPVNNPRSPNGPPIISPLRESGRQTATAPATVAATDPPSTTTDLPPASDPPPADPPSAWRLPASRRCGEGDRSGGERGSYIVTSV